jgi:hypothetical protein
LVKNLLKELFDLEHLKYQFTVKPDQIAIAKCNVNKPFKVLAYQIEKENVYVSSLAFDGDVFQKINDDWGNYLLDKEWEIQEDFSFVVDGCSLSFPEKVEVTLYGEYV